MIKKASCLVLTVLFSFQSLFFNVPLVHADMPVLAMPVSNQLLALSTPSEPIMLQGLRYNPQTPFRFQFIIQQGDKALPLDQLRDQGMNLVRYFLAAITIPEEDLWVNLSPYEKNKIIPEGLGLTRLGSDMLVQDYVLKQLSSSLTFPDSKSGSDFWHKIYSETERQLGRTDIPVSTFNKVSTSAASRCFLTKVSSLNNSLFLVVFVFSPSRSSTNFVLSKFLTTEI